MGKLPEDDPILWVIIGPSKVAANATGCLVMRSLQSTCRPPARRQPRQDDVRMCLPEDHIAQCCIFFGAKIPGTMMVLVELMK
jgi:hypothetical protein